MLSIGWVMFWKAVVVAVWIAIVERWHSFRKKRRAEQGVWLKPDKKTGAYIAKREWPDHIERVLIFGRNAVYAYTFALWTILAFFFLTGQRDVLAKFVQGLFAL